MNDDTPECLLRAESRASLSYHQEVQVYQFVLQLCSLAVASYVCLLSGISPCLAQTAAILPAQEQSVRPDINKNFLDPELDPDQWVDRFETESREVFRLRDKIVAAVNLQSGDSAADIGAGTGLFSLLMAKEVGPDGWVFAVDIAPAFLQRIGSLADDRHQTNITPVLGGATATRLPPDSIDVAFVCDTYHHFEYPQLMLASIHRALRAEGRLIIVDFERIPGVSREWTLDHVRAGKTKVRQEIEAAKFELVDEKNIEGLDENYFLMFKAAPN